MKPNKSPPGTVQGEPRDDSLAGEHFRTSPSGRDGFQRTTGSLCWCFLYLHWQLGRWHKSVLGRYKGNDNNNNNNNRVYALYSSIILVIIVVCNSLYTCYDTSTFLSGRKERKKLNHGEVKAVKGAELCEEFHSQPAFNLIRLRNKCCKHEYTQTHAHPKAKPTLTCDVWTLRSKSSTTTSFIAPLEESTAVWRSQLLLCELRRSLYRGGTAACHFDCEYIQRK